MRQLPALLLILLTLLANPSRAEEPVLHEESTNQSVTPDEEAIRRCLQVTLPTAGNEMTVGDLRAACRELQSNKPVRDKPEAVGITSQTTAGPEQTTGEHGSNAPSGRILDRRLNMEALNRANRFLLTPHKRNYLLPVSYQSSRNGQLYAEAQSPLADLQNTEVEFQLSVKILLREAIFGDNGHLYAAYTNHSLWQAYNQSISRPFRETNHQPELILSFVNDWEILGFRNVLNEFILNHHSNGQGGILSRSWNRVMFNTVFERGPVAFSLMPWYRIPEDEKSGPMDPTGDDNPDIDKFLGNFELTLAYQRKDQLISLMLRNNLRSDNKGAVELSWSFPVSRTLRGYVKYFNGYGHSLIDYNFHTNAIGIGFTFTDLF